MLSALLYRICSTESAHLHDAEQYNSRRYGDRVVGQYDFHREANTTARLLTAMLQPWEFFRPLPCRILIASSIIGIVGMTVSSAKTGRRLDGGSFPSKLSTGFQPSEKLVFNG